MIITKSGKILERQKVKINKQCATNFKKARQYFLEKAMEEYAPLKKSGVIRITPEYIERDYKYTLLSHIDPARMSESDEEIVLDLLLASNSDKYIYEIIIENKK